jgi:hypothetical protein
MNRRVPLILLITVGLLAAPSIAAAADPALTATVIPGQEISITGSGFPADADVVLAISRNGAAAGSRTLRTDAAGAFTASIDAGPGLGGAYTLVATSGTATATVDVVAVETAGGGVTGTRQETPPPTDTALSLPVRPASDSGWALAFGAVVAGLLLLARHARQRRDPRIAQRSSTHSRV